MINHDQLLPVRVFIASSSELAVERAMVLKALQELTVVDNELENRIHFVPVCWDHPSAQVPLDATRPAQDSVIRQKGKPSDCEIVVAMLWSRLGQVIEHEDYRKAKADGGGYMTGTEWEIEDAANNKRDGLPRLQLYVCTRPPVPKAKDNTSEAMEAASKLAIQELKRLERFLKNWKQRFGATPTPYDNPAEFQALVKNDLRQLGKEMLRQELADTARAESVAGSPTEPLWTEAPYVGLSAFQPDQSPIFFGRNVEIEQLLRLVLEPDKHFGVVLGPSGSGKSSLVLAGILPRLPSVWLSCAVRVTDQGGRSDPDPTLSLANVLCRMHEGWDKTTVADDLEAGSDTCRETIDALLAGAGDGAELLIYLDQFEELFTQVSEKRQETFLAVLGVLCTLPKFHALVSMRDEFTPELNHWPVLARLQRAGFSFPLGKPDSGDLYEMALGPARLANLDVTPELALQLVHDTEAQASPLPLFELTLDTLWKVNPGAPLDLPAYRTFGGVGGVVRTLVATALEQMKLKKDQLAPQVFEPLFSHVVDVHEGGPPTRKTARREDLARDPALAERIQILCNQRLLTTRGEFIEVSHESLFTEWEELAGWIGSRAEAFREWRYMVNSAQAWDAKGRPDDLLWTQKRLEDFLDRTRKLELETETGSIEAEFLVSEWCRCWRRLQDPATEHSERARIGETLNEMGDSRPGADLDTVGRPRIGWCRVPAGTVELEGGAGTFTIDESFLIAKYPVTYKQYRAFLEEGYDREDAAWWRDLDRKPEPGQQFRTSDNHPADNVSWYDAMAFCGWLTARLRDTDSLPAGKIIRLPTEWEWQQAATGGDRDRDFPWGNWREGHANSAEAKIGRTTAVGMYPHGSWDGGPQDMAGNVWEWCFNTHKPIKTSLGGDESRVLRGGSWFFNQGSARADSRFDNPPRGRLGSDGFRVVCGSPIR